MAAYCMWDLIAKKFFKSANVVFNKTAFDVQFLYQKYIDSSSAPPIDLFEPQPSFEPISFEEVEEETLCEEESQDGEEELIHGLENFEYLNGFYESGAYWWKPFLLMKRVSIWIRQSGRWTPWFFLNLKSDLILPWRNEFNLFTFNYCYQNKFFIKFFGNHWKNLKKWSFKLMNQNNVLKSVLKMI